MASFKEQTSACAQADSVVSLSVIADTMVPLLKEGSDRLNAAIARLNELEATLLKNPKKSPITATPAVNTSGNRNTNDAGTLAIESNTPKSVGPLKKRNILIDSPTATKEAHLKMADENASFAFDPLMTQRLVPGLFKVLSNTTDPRISEEVLVTLQMISKHDKGQLIISESGGIPALIGLLSSPIDSVLIFALLALKKELKYYVSKRAFYSASEFSKLFELLPRHNAKVEPFVIDCLHELEYGDQEHESVVLSPTDVRNLLHSMRTGASEILLDTVSCVLTVISVPDKLMILKSGGLKTLTDHLDNRSQYVVRNCLWTLRNISVAVTRPLYPEALPSKLVAMLGSQDVVAVTCAAETLLHFVCKFERFREKVIRVKGVDALVNAIFNAGDNKEIIEPVVRALRHLITPDALTSDEQNEVRLNVFGMHLVAELLEIPAYAPMISSALRPISLVQTMRTSNDENLLFTISHELEKMSEQYMDMLSISAVGGLDALAMHLNSKSQSLVKSCLRSLHKFYHANARIEHPEKLVSSLLTLLASPDAELVNHAVSILRSMAENNKGYKEIIYHANGIKAMITIINDAGVSAKTIKVAVEALISLTSHHEFSDSAQNTVRLAKHGIRMIVEGLNLKTSLLSVQRVIDLIREMAMQPAYHIILRELNVIDRLTRLLSEVQRYVPQKDSEDKHDGFIVTTRILGLLLILARDSNNKVLFCEPNTISIFINLLSNPSNTIRRGTVDILGILAVDTEITGLIKDIGYTVPHLEWCRSNRNKNPDQVPPLFDLQHPDNAGIAQVIAFHMSEDKSDEARKQFRAESMTAIVRYNEWYMNKYNDLSPSWDLKDFLIPKM